MGRITVCHLCDDSSSFAPPPGEGLVLVGMYALSICEQWGLQAPWELQSYTGRVPVVGDACLLLR